MVDDLDHMIAEVRALLESQSRVKGRDFAAQIRKAGRLLPRAVRRDARFLIAAERLGQNPKLARMIDMTKAQRAHRNLVTFLKDVDPHARLRANMLSITASVALVLIVTFVVVLFVLVQRGFV